MAEGTMRVIASRPHCCSRWL